MLNQAIGLSPLWNGLQVAKICGTPIRHSAEGTGPHRSDQEVLERALSAKNGDNFKRLWEGDYSGYVTAGQPDKSRADWQLVRYLLYWTNNDPIQTDRLFRQSGLYSLCCAFFCFSKAD